MVILGVNFALTFIHRCHIFILHYFPLFIWLKDPQLNYCLESKSSVSRMRGKHVSESVEFFETNRRLILVD